jgi:hypothetical protein
MPRKRLFRALGLLCGLGLAAVAWVRLSQFSLIECADDLGARASSPDDRLNAILFEHDCGATTNTVTLVALVDKLPGRSNDTTIVITADGAALPSPGRPPSSRAGNRPAGIRWISADTLEVTLPATLHVTKHVDRARGVTITIERSHSP